MLSLVAPLFLILFPAFVARGAPAWRILLAGAGAWAIVAGVEWALTAAPLSEVIPPFARPNTALNTTFYEISYLQIALAIALLLFLLCPLTGQLDHGLWTVTAWVLILSLVLANHGGSVAFKFFSMPDVDDTFALATFFERVNNVVTLAAGLASLSVLTLCLAGLWTSLRRLISR